MEWYDKFEKIREFLSDEIIISNVQDYFCSDDLDDFCNHGNHLLGSKICIWKCITSTESLFLLCLCNHYSIYWFLSYISKRK